uniref:Uncharacterized protein n=1 Tax=Onchocerca volvulus TaxID=6282 RepID=A0A8R1Y0C1_ONCVO
MGLDEENKASKQPLLDHADSSDATQMQLCSITFLLTRRNCRSKINMNKIQNMQYIKQDQGKQNYMILGNYFDHI